MGNIPIDIIAGMLAISKINFELAASSVNACNKKKTVSELAEETAMELKCAKFNIKHISGGI